MQAGCCASALPPLPQWWLLSDDCAVSAPKDLAFALCQAAIVKDNVCRLAFIATACRACRLAPFHHLLTSALATLSSDGRIKFV
jgi:hypothetical protein